MDLRWPPLRLFLLLALACSDRVGGLKPVGGAEDSLVSRERYVRRLYLDLAARAPTDAELSAATGRLGQEGNTPATRASLADGLMASPEFAAAFVSELENRAFAGEQPASRYQLLCAVYRNGDPECKPCPDNEEDACLDCDCTMLKAFAAERSSLATTKDDLAAGAPTGDIERRYAGSYVFRIRGSADLTTSALFQIFLGREPGPEEQRNADPMVQPLGNGTNPSGNLFHRLGRDYADLIDIVFTSEVYREAAVAAVFLRYLGRPPTSVERAHFTELLDQAAPDARPVIRAVLSSREYFEL